MGKPFAVIKYGQEWVSQPQRLFRFLRIGFTNTSNQSHLMLNIYYLPLFSRRFFWKRVFWQLVASAVVTFQAHLHCDRALLAFQVLYSKCHLYQQNIQLINRSCRISLMVANPSQLCWSTFNLRLIDDIDLQFVMPRRETEASDPQPRTMPNHRPQRLEMSN